MSFFHITNGLLRQARLLSNGIFRQATPFPLPFKKLDDFFAFGMAGFGRRYAVSLLKKGLTVLLSEVMKATLQNLLAAIILLGVSRQTYAQSFVYDQQTTNAPSFNGDYFNIQPDSPLLQSFMPALPAIGFVQFQFWDISNNGTNGATVYVNLWTGSPNTNSATFLGSTTPVFMPNGFGSSIPGVTNFYFASAIELTAGQTYYLQPVVLSGDNPFDIKVNNDFPHEDYYANGSLFSKGTDVGIDAWFRERVVSVPEPSVLALVGLAGVLVFSFKRRFKPIVLLLLFTSVPSIRATDSIVQATAGEAGLSRISSDTVPFMGTFWVMTIDADGSLIESPYPCLPPALSTLPIYSVTSNKFIVDDTGGELTPSSAKRLSSAQATAAAQSQAEGMADLIDLMETHDDSLYQPNSFISMLDTNSL